LDAIVAQGVEAGGHRGIFEPEGPDEQLGTLALALGAQAAQLGTAFVSCPESAADSAYRQALLNGTVTTVSTRAISGRPARGIVNRLTALGSAPECPPTPGYPHTYD